MNKCRYWHRNVLFKSLGSVQVFERTILCSPRMELFDQKYSKNSEILLQFKI